MSPFASDISVQAFDALHDEPALWREAMHTLAAQVHALPLGDMAAFAKPWPTFLCARCHTCIGRCDADR
jgi:hypothetical protein